MLQGFHDFLLLKYAKPIHLIKYEDLKKDPIREIEGCLKFLFGKSCHMDKSVRDCLKKDLEGKHHRKNKRDIQSVMHYFNKHYIEKTVKMKEMIYERFEQTMIINKLTCKD